MTRSIFDPTGPETEHSGNIFSGPAADENSHMPADVVDGKVSDEEVAEHEAAVESQDDPNAFATPEVALGVQVDETQQKTVPL